MADRSSLRLWGMRILYPLLALVVLFVALLPLDLTPRHMAGPDVLVALTFAWASRRPEQVPMISVAGVMLLADFLLQRPPGLWAGLILIATEWLKSQERRLRDSTFADEMLTVAVTLLIVTLLYRAILSAVIVSPGALSLTAMQFAATLLAYPILTGILYVVFGLRRSAPGEFNPVGRST